MLRLCGKADPSALRLSEVTARQGETLESFRAGKQDQNLDKARVHAVPEIDSGKTEHRVSDPRAMHSYPSPDLVLFCLFLLS